MGYPFQEVSFWEQRNAAVVVRVLEGGKERRGESRRILYARNSEFFFGLARVLPRSRWCGLAPWQEERPKCLKHLIPFFWVFHVL